MRIYLYVILSWFLRLPSFAPIEREMERMMLDPGENLEGARVRIEATRWQFLRGHIRRLEVELDGLRVASGLRLAHCVFEAHDLRVHPWATYVRDNPLLRNVDDVFWTLTLAQDDLEAFFTKLGPVLRGTRVRIEPDGITLERGLGIAAALLDIKTPFKLAGRLEVRPPDIHLDLHTMNAFGISPGASLLRTVLNLVNPVVRAADINRMLRRADIKLLRNHVIHNAFHDIELDDGEARIRGELIVFKPEVSKSE